MANDVPLTVEIPRERVVIESRRVQVLPLRIDLLAVLIDSFFVIIFEFVTHSHGIKFGSTELLFSLQDAQKQSIF